MADGYADDGLDWYRQLIAGGANDPAGSAGNLPGSGPSGYPQASGQGPYMGYPAQAQTNPSPPPGRGFSISQLLGINPANAAEGPPTGFQGAGHYDPITNTWTEIPGHTLNTPQGGPVRPINTPNSSSGQPAYADPAAPTSGFATPQGGPLTTTPNSRTGAPAPGIRTVPPPSEAPTTAPTSTSSVIPGLISRAVPLAAPLLDPRFRDATEESVVHRLQNPLTLTDIWHGITGQTAPATQTAPQSATPPPGPPPPPVTTANQPPINLPPFNVPPPPPQPPMRGVPIPPQPTFHSRGPGAARQQPVGALGDPSVTGGGAAPPSPGEYFATTGNARGASWTPGGFASPPAQHFQTPLTPMFGPGQWIGGGQPGPAAPQVVGRGAPQGGYNVGGIFNNLPNNTFDNSQSGGGRGLAPGMRMPSTPNYYISPITGKRMPFGNTIASATGYAGGL